MHYLRTLSLLKFDCHQCCDKKHFLLLLVAILIYQFSTTAQAATAPNESARITHDYTNDSWMLSWWGRDGITYFIQKSEDLVNWEYVLLIKPGQGARAKWDFTRDFSAKDEPFFIKLKYTDIETHDPWADDFDQDWISNWDELNQNTDPLASDSTDGDFIADDWEIFHMGNVSSMDNRSHADIDGLPDLLEFKQNSDPNRSAFTDADAYSDDFELFFGFDPADSEDPVIDNPTGTTYRYDAAGQLTAVFYASGKSLHYQYDSVGNMTLAY